MSATVQQVPLECHPNLKNIIKAGGGVFSDGRLEFPRYIRGGKNPWYGITDFLFPSIVISVRLPPAGGGFSFSDLSYLGYSDRVGRIHPSSSSFSFSGISAQNGRQPWLLTDVGFVRRGREVLETRSWRWGGVAGWADPIYSKFWSGGESSGNSRQNNRTGSA
jgi:hypothetical protein